MDMSTTSQYQVYGQMPTMPIEQVEALLSLDADTLGALAGLAENAEALGALAEKSEELLALVTEEESQGAE